MSIHICLVEKYIDLEDLPELPNLKTLELTTKTDADIMDVLIQILICSSNLESLHINIEEGSSYSSSPAEAPDFDFLEMECTFEELKKINVTGISDVPHHMGFIEFLLESTPFLETMSITPRVNMTDGRLSFLTGVLKFPRASPEAEIIFVQDQV
ncbi:hypothetical protein L1887_37266 [Cichorium endivia]|nr:hypothetical protein L1887_37266 [Cichorium endivia]